MNEYFLHYFPAICKAGGRKISKFTSISRQSLKSRKLAYRMGQTRLVPPAGKYKKCRSGLVKIVLCKWCKRFFFICRSCYKNHAYCSDQCQLAGYRRNVNKAQRKYRESDEGKKWHRDWVKQRRLNKAIGKNKKSVDYKSTRQRGKSCKISSLIPENGANGATGMNGYAIPDEPLLVLGKTGRCHICGCLGKIVEKFPRRGYEQRRSRKGQIPLRH